MDTQEATLPDVWRYRVSAWTGWPCVCTLWLGDSKFWSTTSVSVWQHEELCTQMLVSVGVLTLQGDSLACLVLCLSIYPRILPVLFIVLFVLIVCCSFPCQNDLIPIIVIVTDVAALGFVVCFCFRSSPVSGPYRVQRLCSCMFCSGNTMWKTFLSRPTRSG